MVWIEEAAKDSMARHILSYSFGFVDRQFGRVILPDVTDYLYPDVYWVAAVKPFCYERYTYRDGKENKMFFKNRINHALRDMLPFPQGFKCSAGSAMRDSRCQTWMMID